MASIIRNHHHQVPIWWWAPPLFSGHTNLAKVDIEPWEIWWSHEQLNLLKNKMNLLTYYSFCDVWNFNYQLRKVRHGVSNRYLNQQTNYSSILWYLVGRFCGPLYRFLWKYMAVLILFLNDWTLSNDRMIEVVFLSCHGRDFTENV